MGVTAPTFADILRLLDALVPTNDQNIDSAPHQAFWRGMTRDQFVSKTTDEWNVTGRLVTPGDPGKSNLFLALSGMSPFDGSVAEQMPDTNQDFNARHATANELKMVETWIKANAPG